MNGTPRTFGSRTVLALGLLALGPAAASAQVVEYYHLDALGSVRMVTNQAGQVVERHDYLPFGEECTAAPCNTTLPGTNTFKFTGKERDGESGLDYFGARYYGSPIGRFTGVDPVFTVRANLVDPQRWNRYAYARNSPSRYVDPDGRAIELVGDHRDKGFELLERVVGGSGLRRVERNSRTFVEATGKLSGGMGSALQWMISSEKIVTVNVAADNTVLNGKTLSDGYGGGATVGSEESASGHTEVYIALNAGAIATVKHLAYPYLNISSDGRALWQSNASVLAHELGHARGNMMGNLIDATKGLAIGYENSYRTSVGAKNMKLNHDPAAFPQGPSI